VPVVFGGACSAGGVGVCEGVRPVCVVRAVTLLSDQWVSVPRAYIVLCSASAVRRVAATNASPAGPGLAATTAGSSAGSHTSNTSATWWAQPVSLTARSSRSRTEAPRRFRTVVPPRWAVRKGKSVVEKSRKFSPEYREEAV